MVCSGTAAVQTGLEGAQETVSPHQECGTWREGGRERGREGEGEREGGREGGRERERGGEREIETEREQRQDASSRPVPLLQVDSKRLPEVVEYYYTWKKYCSDEYRGRNRHISEEV